jgi:hypothetical protein
MFSGQRNRTAVVGVIWENFELMAQVDVAALRTLLYARLVSGTHKEITERFANLGLADRWRGEKSKVNRVREVLEDSSDDALAAAAERLLAAGELAPVSATRYKTRYGLIEDQ